MEVLLKRLEERRKILADKAFKSYEILLNTRSWINDSPYPVYEEQEARKVFLSAVDELRGFESALSLVRDYSFERGPYVA